MRQGPRSLITLVSVAVVTCAFLNLSSHNIIASSSSPATDAGVLLPTNAATTEAATDTKVAEEIKRLNGIMDSLMEQALPTPQPQTPSSPSPLPPQQTRDITSDSFLKVTSSERGNLGPIESILSDTADDWLKDRHQFAVDMSGRPIPGEHWIRLDFATAVHTIEKIVIDFEIAWAEDWALEYGDVNSEKFTLLYDNIADGNMNGNSREETVNGKHHVTTVNLSPGAEKYEPFTSLRMIIRRPKTQWGTSIWRMKIFGN